MTETTAGPLVTALANALRECPSDQPADPVAIAEMLPETDLPIQRRHKVAAPYLWARAARGGLDDVAMAEATRQRRRAAVLADELASVSRLLHAHGVPFAVLRGPALAACYPRGWPREANDVDLVVPTVAEVRPALRVLGEDGYVVARPIVCRRDPAAGGNWLGVALNKTRADLEHPMYLDLTVGGPAIDRTACVAIGQSGWAQRRTVTVAGQAVPVFAGSTLALILAVELMERDDPIGRDLLDYIVVARQRPDWDWLRGQVDTHRIGAGLNRLAGLASLTGLSEEADRLRWLAGTARRRTGLRRAGLAVTDRMYRRVVTGAPRLALAAVEHLPSRVWYHLGLPVYGYPPHPVDGPVRGSGGATVASLPGFRARIRPTARAQEVDDIFTGCQPAPPGAPLTTPELRYWQEVLTEQLASAAPPGGVDRAHGATYVEETIVADGGADGTMGIRREGQLVAAGRVVDCRHPLTLAWDRRIEGLWGDPDCPGAVAELLELVPDDLPVQVTVPDRGTAEHLADPLREHGFRPEVVVVRRPVTASDTASPGVRPATAADAPFVCECLGTAVGRGLFGRSPAVDVSEWVRDRFADVTRDGAVCLVVEEAGRLLGHAYAVLAPDRYRAGRCGFVVDVFVVPDAHGRGLARALSEALENALLRYDVAALESEVALRSPGVSGLRANLATAGWVDDRVRWVREA
ncbi:GNAT family N-acetyltransferase [Plantactinospora sp. WMMC1484]|uniref:GNAT family N-acetyltransferase n=1 Tax=Plantactinospora sp. WMMC1484 TaxID=3404122 RepID=UPI003BF5F3A3